MSRYPQCPNRILTFTNYTEIKQMVSIAVYSSPFGSQNAVLRAQLKTFILAPFGVLLYENPRYRDGGG